MKGKRSLIQILAVNLKALMDTNQVSSAALAKLSGVDKKTVNNMLRGRFATQIDKLEAVAYALDTKPWRLLMDAAGHASGEDGGVSKLIADYTKSDETGRHSILTVADLAARTTPNDE